MSAIREQEFDATLKPRERHAGRRTFRLRGRSAGHPLVLFAIVVGTAVASTALVPASSATIASLGLGATASASAAAKHDRLSVADLACEGQAWGHQSVECLSAIARDSGRAAVPSLRIIADAAPLSDVPNVF